MENMEVTFVLEDQSTFSIEVGFCDSFQEIKEKINKYTNIPVERQKLIFNGEVLRNDVVIASTNIWGDSPIQLLVASASDNNPATPSPSVGPTPPENQEFHPIHTLDLIPPTTSFLDFDTAIVEKLDEFLNSLSDTSPPPQPLPVASPPPSPPSTIKDFQDLEEFLESMKDVKTPTREELEELMVKYNIDTASPPLTASPAPLMPTLLNLDNTEVSSPSPPPPPRTTMKFTVKLVETRMRPFSVEMELDDTVLQLKEKIYRMKKCKILQPSEMSARIKSGPEFVELHDDRTLRDCDMLNISHVFVRKKLKPLPYPYPYPYPHPNPHSQSHSHSHLHSQSQSHSHSHSKSQSQSHSQSPSHPHPHWISPVVAADPILGTKMLKVFVVAKGGTEKIPIEVNIYNRIENLRYELEKFHKHVVPENGRYFFVYQKNGNGHVMTETYAFNWYRMEEGDIIEITPECVSGPKNRQKRVK